MELLRLNIEIAAKDTKCEPVEKVQISAQQEDDELPNIGAANVDHESHQDLVCICYNSIFHFTNIFIFQERNNGWKV